MPDVGLGAVSQESHGERAQSGPCVGGAKSLGYRVGVVCAFLCGLLTPEQGALLPPSPHCTPCLPQHHLGCGHVEAGKAQGRGSFRGRGHSAGMLDLTAMQCFGTPLGWVSNQWDGRAFPSWGAFGGTRYVMNVSPENGGCATSILGKKNQALPAQVTQKVSQQCSGSPV